MIQLIQFYTPIDNIKVIDSTSAGSTWSHSNESHFNSGEKTKVSFTSDGDISIALKTKHVQDTFVDGSKIFYDENITLNQSLNELRLKTHHTFEKFFKSPYAPVAFSGMQTSDGGYITTNSQLYSSFSKFHIMRFDSAGNTIWHKTWGELIVDKYNGGKSVLQTLDGGFLAAGSTKMYGAGNSDAWLIRTDGNGNELWNRTYGGAQNDSAYDIKATNDGSYVFAGSFQPKQNAPRKIWLVKINSTGGEQWNSTINGSYNGYAESIQVTSDGGFVIAGWTSSYGYKNGYYDAWLIKTNSTGHELWNKTYGDIYSDMGFSAIETSDGGLAFIGYTNNSAKSNNFDMWLVKTNSNGTMQWNRTYGGNRYEEGFALAQTSDNGFILTGFQQSFDINKLLWVLKTNETGFEEWNRTYGNKASDAGRAVQQTDDGGYFIAGQDDDHFVGSTYYSYLIKTNSQGTLESKVNGNAASTDMMSGNYCYSIDRFNYTATVSSEGKIKIQFSQDNITWFNSKLVSNGWDYLKNGFNSIDLSFLGWNGPNFYYRAYYSSNDSNIYIPTLHDIDLVYSEYFPSGTFVSQAYTGSWDIEWQSITWLATKPGGTEIKFQLRTSNVYSELLTKDFLGPDGTSSAYYDTSDTEIWPGHSSDRLAQFKLYLSTSNITISPKVNLVMIHFNYLPYLPVPLAPDQNTWLTTSRPEFTWNFDDLDSTGQSEFHWQADNDYDFSSVDYGSGSIASSLSSYKPTFNISDGSWYWRVRTKDTDGSWGGYSSNSIFKIDTDIKPPEGITVEPDTWSNSNSFVVDWVNPPDLSGIKTGAYYYIGKTKPTNQTDGVWVPNKPITVTSTPPGINNLYLWLEDTAGNKDYQKTASIQLKYDPNPPENMSLSINDDAIYAKSPAVDLTISALDILSGLSKMSFMTNGVDWSVDEPYGTSKQIELPPGEGLKTVRVDIKDIAGNSERASDTIVLDTKPPYALAVIINEGDIETKTASVELELSAKDNTSGLDKMSLSSNGKTWEDWIPFSTSLLYDLPTGDGEKTVYFKVVDKAGNTANPVSASIVLNTTVPIKDSDGDGYPDDVDLYPEDPLEWQDSDGDTIGDVYDLFPDDSTQWEDSDEDGYGDNPNGTNPDAFPNDPDEWNDTDSDGVGDNSDLYPNDPTRWEKKDDVQPPPGSKNATGTEEKGNGLIYASIIAVVIIVVILLFLFIIKPKMGELPGKQNAEQPSETAPVQPLCPTCGMPAEVKEGMNFNYCNYCKKFIFK
jgi:hypothetical protein